MGVEIAETRLLEGPNLFLLGPAVKVEVIAASTERATLVQRLGGHALDELGPTWKVLLAGLSASAGSAPPETAVVELDEADHVALVFSWSHRPVAKAIARHVRRLVLGEATDPSSVEAALRAVASEAADPPEMILDADRSTLSIAVTGTNGKTTTTRLLAHIARSAGRSVGWCSSSGVYVNGAMVEEGDYSGPSGAAQVLAHQPEIDVAVLETARGGILLKGLGYQSNDVSVFTNVSGDHLGLHGVLTVETLAEVKSVVCHVTRADGTAVVNAEDELVMASTADVRAQRCLVSTRDDNPAVEAHAAAGGRSVVRVGDAIVACRGREEVMRLEIADIPICFGGKAAHQIENAMSAVGAALAAGFPVESIVGALATFGTEPEHNPGRLNVIDMGAYTVVLDYAHNEAGLRRLIAFGREIGDAEGRVIAVIGSAGDRDPALLRALGEIAAETSDHVVAKGTERYLRGIQIDDLMALYREGASLHPDTPYEEVVDETAAVERISGMARPGDVFVLMFQELQAEVEPILRAAHRSGTT